MIDINTMLQCLIVGMLFMFYLMGYMVGCLKSIQNGQSQNETRPQSFFDRNRQEAAHGGSIEIDERKIVTDINTGGIEKKYAELGETKVSDENILSSINKLKGLKR